MSALVDGMRGCCNEFRRELWRCLRHNRGISGARKLRRSAGRVVRELAASRAVYLHPVHREARRFWRKRGYTVLPVSDRRRNSQLYCMLHAVDDMGREP